MHSVLVSSPKRLAKAVGFPLLGSIDMRALACAGAEGIPRNGHSWVLREPCSQDTPGPPPMMTKSKLSIRISPFWVSQSTTVAPHQLLGA